MYLCLVDGNRLYNFISPIEFNSNYKIIIQPNPGLDPRPKTRKLSSVFGLTIIELNSIRFSAQRCRVNVISLFEKKEQVTACWTTLHAFAIKFPEFHYMRNSFLYWNLNRASQLLLILALCFTNKVC